VEIDMEILVYHNIVILKERHRVFRKLVTYAETTYLEGGREAAKPLRLFAAAAIVRNPWYGRGFVEDLSPESPSGNL
jgi:hypothetical protein